MQKHNRFFKRITGICLAFIMMLSTSYSVVFADEDASATDGANKSALVDQVAQYLSMYARYDTVTQQNLYKDALLKAVEQNPELYESVMKTMLESIDEHSEYYTPEEATAMKERISGTIVGIGITFQMNSDGVDVQSVIGGTPAERAGIQVGDVIVSADGIEFSGMNSDTAASYIKGAEGTTVTLGIKRPDTGNIIYMQLKREPIIGNSVISKVYGEGKNKMMYIRVSGFVSNTAELFKNELDSASSQGITRITIDLRNNGGGLLDQAIQMADYLLPKDTIITTEDHKINLLNVTYKAESDDTRKFDTVVLINKNSASASEVLTAALSENDRAYLIGEKSYGKGTIQTIADLPYGDCMKYTMGFYLTPKGNNINGVGITPDDTVENTLTPFDIDKYQKFGYTRVYNIGDSGAEVKTAKELLKICGLYDGEINDEYDAATADAIYNFQSRTGLYPYGTFDLTTQHELYERMKATKVEHDDQLKAALEHFGIDTTEIESEE